MLFQVISSPMGTVGSAHRSEGIKSMTSMLFQVISSTMGTVGSAHRSEGYQIYYQVLVCFFRSFQAQLVLKDLLIDLRGIKSMTSMLFQVISSPMGTVGSAHRSEGYQIYDQVLVCFFRSFQAQWVL